MAFHSRRACNVKSVSISWVLSCDRLPSCTSKQNEGSVMVLICPVCGMEIHRWLGWKLQLYRWTIFNRLNTSTQRRGTVSDTSIKNSPVGCSWNRELIYLPNFSNISKYVWWYLPYYVRAMSLVHQARIAKNFCQTSLSSGTTDNYYWWRVARVLFMPSKLLPEWRWCHMNYTIQYSPRNMHTVFALLCFVVVIHWLVFPYPSGLLHWHCGNLTIAPVPAKQPWWIWINTSCEFIMNDCITTTKQSTTKQCAYFLGYTVCTQHTTYKQSMLECSLYC